MRAIYLLGSALVIAMAPCAQAKDPLTILGIPLGQPFTVPACATNPDGSPDFSRTCWTPLYDQADMKNLWYNGDPVIGHGIIAHVHDGILTTLTFETQGIKNEDYVMGKLVEKFGKPNHFVKEPMQNGFGAQFYVYRAEWDNASVYVKYDADADDGTPDSGWIIIETAQWHSKEEAARAQYLKDHPSTL